MSERKNNPHLKLLSCHLLRKLPLFHYTHWTPCGENTLICWSKISNYFLFKLLKLTCCALRLGWRANVVSHCRAPVASEDAWWQVAGVENSAKLSLEEESCSQPASAREPADRQAGPGWDVCLFNNTHSNLLISKSTHHNTQQQHNTTTPQGTLHEEKYLAKSARSPLVPFHFLSSLKFQLISRVCTI